MDRTSVWCLPHRLLLDERKLRPRFVYLDIMAMLLSKAAPPAVSLRQQPLITPSVSRMMAAWAGGQEPALVLRSAGNACL
jgi:hypothetical protein